MGLGLATPHDHRPYDLPHGKERVDSDVIYLSSRGGRGRDLQLGHGVRVPSALRLQFVLIREWGEHDGGWGQGHLEGAAEDVEGQPYLPEGRVPRRRHLRRPRLSDDAGINRQNHTIPIFCALMFSLPPSGRRRNPSSQELRSRLFLALL